MYKEVNINIIHNYLTDYKINIINDHINIYNNDYINLYNNTTYLNLDKNYIFIKTNTNNNIIIINLNNVDDIIIYIHTLQTKNSVSFYLYNSIIYSKCSANYGYLYKEKNNFYKENRNIYTTISKKNKLIEHNWLIWYFKKTNNIKKKTNNTANVLVYYYKFYNIYILLKYFDEPNLNIYFIYLCII